jgi:hypothetical protein
LIRVKPWGYIEESFVARIKAIVEEFQARIGWEPILLEVNVYPTSERMMMRIAREAEELGVAVLGSFPVMHEAWRGWPRIHVSYEECAKLDEKVFKALLVHELAHSKLHGSPYYYVVSVDADLLEDYGREALVVAYMASTAVKDFEVFELLRGIGCNDEIASYAAYVKPQLESVKCNDLIGVLELAKLITPHVVMGLEVGNLDVSCSSIVGEVVNALKLLPGIEDFDEKVKFLINMLRAVGENRKDL